MPEPAAPSLVTVRSTGDWRERSAASSGSIRPREVADPRRRRPRSMRLSAPITLKRARAMYVAISMAYDEDLADRIRRLLKAEKGLSEMAMFGGLAFLLGGNIAVVVPSQAGLLVRVGADGAEDALERPHAAIAQMGERVMSGWIMVEPAGYADSDELAAWVERGVECARALPPKRAGKRGETTGS